MTFARSEYVTISNSIIINVEDGKNIIAKYNIGTNNIVTLDFEISLKEENSDYTLPLYHKISFYSSIDIDIFLKYINLIFEYKESIIRFLKGTSYYSYRPVKVSRSNFEKVKSILPKIKEAALVNDIEKINNAKKLFQILDEYGTFNKVKIYKIYKGHAIDLHFTERVIINDLQLQNVYKFISLSRGVESRINRGKIAKLNKL